MLSLSASVNLALYAPATSAQAFNHEGKSPRQIEYETRKKLEAVEARKSISQLDSEMMQRENILGRGDMAELRRYQNILKRLGFNPGTIDGHPGRHTTSAVVRFQRSVGLNADGILGPVTKRALREASRTNSNKIATSGSGLLKKNGDSPKASSAQAFSMFDTKDVNKYGNLASRLLRPTSNKVATSNQDFAVYQQLLKDNGFDPGKVDGHPGKNTTEAIRRFQRSRGLEPDGIIGPDTKAALESAETQAKNIEIIQSIEISEPEYDPNFIFPYKTGCKPDYQYIVTSEGDWIPAFYESSGEYNYSAKDNYGNPLVSEKHRPSSDDLYKSRRVFREEQVVQYDVVDRCEGENASTIGHHRTVRMRAKECFRQSQSVACSVYKDQTNVALCPDQMPKNDVWHCEDGWSVYGLVNSILTPTVMRPSD